MSISKFFDKNSVKYYYLKDVELDEVPDDLNIKEYDYVIKSPGIKFDNHLLKIFEKASMVIISDLELYYLLSKNDDTIIVTGTNGKTTTCYLINDILYNNQDNLCGNMGNSIFNIDVFKKRKVIIEASSFMLHNTYTYSPHVLVITSLKPHHLDYHKNVLDYYYDKLKLINNLSENDYLVYNLDDLDLVNEINKYDFKNKCSFSLTNNLATCYISNGYVLYNGKKVLNIDGLNNNSDTFLHDVLAAIIVCKIYKIKNNKIFTKIKEFTSPPFRLEKIYDNSDVIIFNDSKSTSPYATAFAIKHINKYYKNYEKILILGGIIKDSDYSEVNLNIDSTYKVMVFGKNCDRLNDLLKVANVEQFEKLEDVVNNIRMHSNLVVLFSPSGQSYDYYKSFFERGIAFDKLINDKINA